MVEEAHQIARDILATQRDNLDLTSEILLRRETIEREQFIQLLDGKSEEEVFGPDEPRPQIPPPRRSPQRERPRPLPRPPAAGSCGCSRTLAPPRLNAGGAAACE